jgi:Caspase domain
MPAEPLAPVQFRGPAYALVIGITIYEYGQPPDDGKDLEKKNFRHLTVAAKDAKDFAAFLTTRGFNKDNVILLPDASATNTSIKIAFNKLSQWCKDPDVKDPLVIVYFSGHGMADDEHHYLVPHDGQRDELSSTAFSNDVFNGFLDKLNTSRLVVFLDACHSGGLIGMEKKGAKDGAVAGYDYSSLGSGKGRIVIASCKRGEQSYEKNGNGIFTGKLLSLLCGDSPYFSDKEEIDVLELYPVLKKEVSAAAKPERQEPQINDVKEFTGIVLAVNPGVKQRRVAREKRLEFLDSIVSQLKSLSNAGPTTTIAAKLRTYVDSGDKMQGHDTLYGIFDEHEVLWGPGDDFLVAQCCELLVKEHAFAIASLRSAAKSSSRESSKPADKERSKPLDSMESTPRITLVDSQGPRTLVTPGPQSGHSQPPRSKTPLDIQSEANKE